MFIMVVASWPWPGPLRHLVMELYESHEDRADHGGSVQAQSHVVWNAAKMILF